MQLFSSCFNKKPTMYTYIDVKPNANCIIPNDFERPKKMTITISICCSIIAVIFVVSIAGITCDIKRIYLKTTEGTPELTGALVI